MSTSPKRQPIPFGKYLLLDRINVGGMAEVWRGKQVGASGFERLVAIKRILPNVAEDEEFIHMFIDEAKITVQLTHANVAQVFELGHIQNSYFISMEYIAGKDMRAIFDRGRKKGEPAPVPLTCYVVAKLCEGLDYAHRKKDSMGRDMNIVHRDVSPQNVLVSYEGEVKVIDFGIAKAAGKATKTQAGILKGKFAYMSPEQIRGMPLDRRSDIFAIGICLYEMLTGERLFVGDSDFSVLEKVRKAEVTPPSQFNKRIPEALEKIVLKALAKEVEDRYQYANEVADDLQRFLITSDSIFSRKDLMQYLRSTFAEDVEREKLRLQEYAEIKVPEGMLAAAELGLAPIPASNPGFPMIPEGSGPIPIRLVPTPVEAAAWNNSDATMTKTPAPPAEAIRRTPSLPHLPKLTAAAPLLSNPKQEHIETVIGPTTHSGPVSTTGPTVEADSPEPVTGPHNHPPESVAAPEEQSLGGTPVPATAITHSGASAQLPPTRAGRLPRSRSKDRVPAVRPKPPQEPATLDEGEPLTATTTHPGGPEGLSRRQVFVFAGLGALVALVVAGILYFAFGRTPATGWLMLYVPPELESKLHININGEDIDSKQVQQHVLMRPMKPGPAVVLLTADGFEPYTEAVTVLSGQMAPVRANLKPNEDAVELAIALEPEQAEVAINGEIVKREGDKTPIYLGRARMGQEVRVDVRCNGYKPQEQKKVATRAGLSFKFRLDPVRPTP